MAPKRKQSSSSAQRAPKRPRTGSGANSWPGDPDHEGAQEASLDDALAQEEPPSAGSNAGSDAGEGPVIPGGSFFAHPASSPLPSDALASPSDEGSYEGEGHYDREPETHSISSGYSRNDDSGRVVARTPSVEDNLGEEDPGERRSSASTPRSLASIVQRVDGGAARDDQDEGSGDDDSEGEDSGDDESDSTSREATPGKILTLHERFRGSYRSRLSNERKKLANAYFR